jgi:hypothetical protein
MKTKAISGLRIQLVAFVFLCTGIHEAFPQQLIRYHNGSQESVKILYQSKDTVKYTLVDEPGVTRTVLRSLIDTIIYLDANREYQSAKMLKNTGIGLLVGGGVLTVTGLAIIISSVHKGSWGIPEYTGSETASKTAAVFIALGISSLITGAILTSTGSKKVKECLRKQHGLSFDFNCRPGMTGVSVKYRF